MTHPKSRRTTINTKTFINLHPQIQPKRKHGSRRPGMCYLNGQRINVTTSPRVRSKYKYDFWNYMAHRGLFSPYTWICAWDIGPDSLSEVDNWNVIDCSIPYAVFRIIHTVRLGLITGYMTEEDMHLAIKEIDKNYLLIAYSVQNKQDAITTFMQDEEEYA